MNVELAGWPLFRRGKVRDTYDLGDHLLMIASDRISAFDVVLPTAIPGKGIVLTQLSRFWFKLTDGLVPNHRERDEAIRAEITGRIGADRSDLAGRTMLVRKAERIDIECVVRGYLAGSAWSEYRASGSVAGEALPEGLERASELPAPMFTPSTKVDDGHDVTISRADLAGLVGADLALRLEEASRDLYGVAHDFARQRGIVLADTKFEFGMVDGRLTLIDEVLTPDSSRFWDATTWRPGIEPPSFDKQPVRDWLSGSGWDRRPPAPDLPAEVVAGTVDRYGEAFRRLTGFPVPASDVLSLV